MKKWIGGAKKHGVLLNSMTNQLDNWGRELDKSTGDLSHLNSSIPEKRKAKENELKEIIGIGEEETKSKEVAISEEVVDTLIEETIEPHIINVSAENLRTALLEYLEHDSVDEGIAEEITVLIAKKSLSNAEVASKVLTYGNLAINTQVKNWVLNHIHEDLTINKLKIPAALYFVKHNDHKDVAAAIKSAGDNVEEFAKALFSTDHSELSADVASCALLGEYSTVDI